MVILQQGQTWNLLSFPNRWALNPWCLFPQEDRRQNLFSSLGIGKLKRKKEKKWKNTINLNNLWSYNFCKRTVWSNFLLRMCEEYSIFKLLNGGDILGTWEFWLLYSQTMGKRRLSSIHEWKIDWFDSTPCLTSHTKHFIYRDNPLSRT